LERKEVDSSNIKTVGYMPEHKILEIEFHSGAIYRYAGVPKKVFVGLMRAKSKGKYFNKKVKTQPFKYKRNHSAERARDRKVEKPDV